MLEKIIVIDSIKILEDSQIEIQQATKIIDNGVEISRVYHNWCLAPGQVLQGQTARVTKAANAMWTPDVIAAYKAKLINLPK